MFPPAPKRPEGSDAEANWHKTTHDVLWDPKVNLFIDTAEIKFDKTPKGYLPKITIPKRTGFAGWHFDTKIEVDNTKSYPAQTVIHIQDTHALVTTGIRDAANPAGGLVTSCAGFWVSTQAVPAKAVVSGNDVWNLPQYPYPAPTNMDHATNFWIYLGEVVAC